MTLLVVRQDQVEQILRGRLQAYEDELVAHLAQAWPREARLAGGEPGMRQAVRRIVRAAQDSGYGSRTEITQYAKIVISLGFGFARDPQFGWAASSLGNLAIADPTERIGRLYDEMLDSLGAVAGDDGGRTVRALLRVRRHDFTQAPGSEDDDPVEATCDLLEAFWPEKLAFQELAPTAAMVAAAGQRAAARGITDRAGVCVYATLAFFLGLGFANDPMHPWAARALAAPAPERAGALREAGLARLAESLTPG